MRWLCPPVCYGMRVPDFLAFISPPRHDDVSEPIHLNCDFADASCAPGSNGEELLGMR